MLRYIAGKGMGFDSSHGEALENAKKCDFDHKMINNYVSRSGQHKTKLD